MSNTPERVWLDETSEDELGMFVVSKTDEYVNMDITYVRGDIVEKLEKRVLELEGALEDITKETLGFPVYSRNNGPNETQGGY